MMAKTKLWGGRFKKKINPILESFSKSIGYDKRLAAYDVIGSLMQIDILKDAKILTTKEHGTLSRELKSVLVRIRNNRLTVDESFEDIHSFMQAYLEKKCGKVALKLHTGRSRNDQIVFDVKLFCIEQINILANHYLLLMRNLSKLAKKYQSTVMPGFTHMQHAQPILFADFIKAYMLMFGRDRDRLVNIVKTIRVTFGAGALAGNFIPYKHFRRTVKLGKHKVSVYPTENSIDVVSSRDFIIEILNALAVAGMHFSRFAEDLILWGSPEFGFIDLDETFCTGSSLMPQKKNPDSLELIRGSSGKLFANAINLLTVMKGLPLSYNRDMQLDKEPLFQSLDVTADEVRLLAHLASGIKLRKENIKKHLEDETLFATDLADYLVTHGVPFKEAHAVIGKLVAGSLAQNKKLCAMSDRELGTYHELLNSKVVKRIIHPEVSVRAKKSIKRK